MWKLLKKVQRKNWSNTPPKMLACIGFLYKVVHKIGRLRKLNRSREIEFKGAVSRYSVIFCAFFARANNGDCSRKCRGHRTMTARSAARTTSPPKLSRANIVFRGLALWPPLFFPHKMAAKNHRPSWHCRFNFLTTWNISMKLGALVQHAAGYKTLPHSFDLLPRDLYMVFHSRKNWLISSLNFERS